MKKMGKTSAISTPCAVTARCKELAAGKLMSAIDSPWSTPIIEATPRLRCRRRCDPRRVCLPFMASLTINFPTMA